MWKWFILLLVIKSGAGPHSKPDRVTDHNLIRKWTAQRINTGGGWVSGHCAAGVIDKQMHSPVKCGKYNFLKIEACEGVKQI